MVIPGVVSGVSKESYRPYSHPFPQIIQASDYPTIEAIEALAHDMNVQRSAVACASGKVLELRSSEANQSILILVRNGRVSFSGHEYSNDKTLALFSTLQRILGDLSPTPCVATRADQFATRAYKRRSILEFDLGSTVLVVDALSNGPDNDERLYILDTVQRNESFFWAHNGALQTPANRALQPTRAAWPNDQREPARVGSRG
jgi:hypothetical protein